MFVLEVIYSLNIADHSVELRACYGSGPTFSNLGPYSNTTIKLIISYD
jgi:hypothetical protein